MPGDKYHTGDAGAGDDDMAEEPTMPRPVRVGVSKGGTAIMLSEYDALHALGVLLMEYPEEACIMLEKQEERRATASG